MVRRAFTSDLYLMITEFPKEGKSVPGSSNLIRGVESTKVPTGDSSYLRKEVIISNMNLFSTFSLSSFLTSLNSHSP